jgi:HK97 family phage major capsid protein
VKELAGILKWSDRLDMESFAQPGVREIVRREIVAAASDKVDRALWNNASTDDSEITGLLSQSGFQTVSFGSQPDLGEDMRYALRLVRAANHEPSAWVAHSTALDELLSIRTTQGELKYPSVNSPTPTLWGKPLVVSNNLPSSVGTDGDTRSDVVLADWSTVVVATMPVSIRISDVAYVDGESLWEHDKSAIRYVTNVSSPLLRRPEAVCVVRDVQA